MAYERTTIDVYEIHTDYGQGWEYEIAEFTIRAARERKREYAENCPQYPTRIVKRRERKADYTPDQLASIEREIQETYGRAREARAARIASR